MCLTICFVDNVRSPYFTRKEEIDGISGSHSLSFLQILHFMDWVFINDHVFVFLCGFTLELLVI